MGQQITYDFGSFRLCTATELLCKENTPITIAPKIYRLLIYFLQNPGRLISHEELFNSVWEGRFVDDSAIRQAVNSLRNALQDKHKAPEYIATVCKKGYRFSAKVSINTPLKIVKAELRNPLHYRAQALSAAIDYENSLQVAELVQAFQEASNGERRLVFLQGEQQAGKTVMLNNFLSNIHYPELSVLRARCVKLLGVTEPFMPLLEALERHCGDVHGKLLIEYMTKLAPSWLHNLLNVLSSDELATLQLKSAQSNALHMLREGAELIEALSKDTAFILVLDNAHWSDQSTLDLLNFLMFRCAATKLLIIISYRSCDTGVCVQRLAKMREELVVRGVGRELVVQIKST